LASGQFEIAVARASACINDGGDNYRNLAFSQYFAGQRTTALETAKLIISDNPSIFDVNEIVRMYLGLKMYALTVEIIESKKEDNLFDNARTQGLYAVGLFHIGRLKESDVILNDLKQRSEKSRIGSPAFHVAMIYGQRGEMDTAFEWLENAYQGHEVEMYWLKVVATPSE